MRLFTKNLKKYCQEDYKPMFTKILKKDVEWNAEEAINFGLVDEIYQLRI